MPLQKIIISIDYPYYNLLEEEINKYDVINLRFSNSVDITLGVDLNKVDEFKTLFQNVTRGKGLFIVDNIYNGLKKA